MPIQEDKPAPAFTLPDASGKKVTLADLAGQNRLPKLGEGMSPRVSVGAKIMRHRR